MARMGRPGLSSAQKAELWHRVLEVVTDVGDAVGPADDLALGRARRRSGPGVVADAVEGSRGRG